MKIVCDVDIQSVVGSKLFRTNPRRNSILKKMNSIGSSTALVSQSPDQLDVKFENNVIDLQVEDNKQEADLSAPSDEFSSDNVDEVDNKISLPSDSVLDKEIEENKPEPLMNAEPKEGNHSIESCSSVEASSGTSLTRTDVTDNMDLEVKDIKGILNSREDTCGVSRVQETQKEVWIYYNDSVNLNDMMVPVIEELNRPGYTYLTFNRLARSENAIVFIVLYNDTYRDKKPQSFSEED